MSVFVATKARPAAVQALGDELRTTKNVAQVYFESAAEAFAEYARLYTCSAQVPKSAVPASYRLVLDKISHAQRDALVRQIAAMPGVQGVSCDPSDPCVNATRRSK